MTPTFFDGSTDSSTDYLFGREYLITSGRGLYASSTISGCNTRKYHGLLVAPHSTKEDDSDMLLSNLDEVVTVNNNTYQLATHKYPSVKFPDGYRYIREFYGNPVPTWILKVGDVVIRKQLLFSYNDDGVLIKYTMEETNGPAELKLIPLLAFRNVHHVGKTNTTVNKKVNKLTGGIKLKLYAGYPEMFMQTSGTSEFVQAPDWYYNIEYPVEQARGYDYHEDLFTPGYFTTKMKKGDQLIFFAGLKEITPKLLKRHYTSSLKKYPVLNTMGECLEHAAQQFIVKKDHREFVKAGYHWFDSWGRDTFISLPGLTLVQGHFKTFEAIIKSLLPDLKHGLFPNAGTGKNAIYNSADASLWFIWTIQQYASYTNNEHTIWTMYGKVLQDILEHYRKGILHKIKMDDDGLIWAEEQGTALTWMDSVVNGTPVTPRCGKPVEINALWYNAVCFCMRAATLAEDKAFNDSWGIYPEKIAAAFQDNFWSEEKQQLADCTNKAVKDWSVRPNQVFAASLPYSPVPGRVRKAVVDKVKNELLTPRGLRTLSPADPNYKGYYSGDQPQRDNAYHQGSVWPWLMGHFAEAYLRVYNEDAIPLLEDLYEGFEQALTEKCLYSIAELYSGNAPHEPGGAVAQAWSVAEVIRMRHLIDEHKNMLTENTAIKNLSL